MMQIKSVFFKHASAALFGRPGITLLLLLSIAGALFSVDVIYGYGNGIFHTQADNIHYSSFSMTDLRNNIRVTETDIRTYIYEQCGVEAAAVLYFTRHEEPDNPFGESLIVGYDSELPLSRWWAGTSGRNEFSISELEAGAHVAYISDSVKAASDSLERVKIDQTEYAVIGSAFFVDMNIMELLPQTEAEELMPRYTGHDMQFRHYYVIPYKTYETEGYRPDFIIVKTHGLDTESVIKTADAVFQDFQGISGAYPPLDTADLKSENDVRYGIYGGILCVGAWLGAIGVFSLWVMSQRKKAWVFMACGLSRKRLMLYSCMETLILVTAGKVISWTACMAFSAPLKNLKVVSEPFSVIPLSATAVTAVASMMIVALSIFRMTRTQKNYE